MTRPTFTRTGLRIGIAHDVPRDLQATPRGIAPQARATGYAAPNLLAHLTRALRALLTPKGPTL